MKSNRSVNIYDIEQKVTIEDRDVRLLLHCRNHFMKALEALKQAERQLAMLEGEKGEWSMELSKVIEELETVN